MKKLKIHILILCFTYISVSSQNEANNWYFGDHAGISFNSGVVTPITDSAIFTFEGCSSYSDSNGNLLFYTDGITVWNRNNQPMPNGLGLEGNPSSAQSGLIVPNPDDTNIYYLFTVGTAGTPVGLPPNPGFKYYIVDMSVDDGLGDIVSSPVNLSVGQDDVWSERVTSVQNTDCDGFWVISFAESVFYSYLVTNTGVTTTPVISNLSSVIPVTDVDLGIFQDRRGYLKASPGGTKLACAMAGSGMYLFDFNATTGVISNGKELELSENSTPSYGVEFSLNGRLLYVSTGTVGSQGGGTSGFSEVNLFQFEITSNNINEINESRNLIHTYNNARGALQLAPNGKIYWASDLDPFLSVINNPDNATNVNFEFLSVDLGGNNSFEGLPPFLQSLFVANLDLVNDGTGILATQLDLCHGETWTLETLDPDIPANALYEWSLNGVSLGLPNTTTSITIDINNAPFYGAGFYELEVDYQDGSCEHRGILLVTFRDDPNLNPLSTIIQCDNDTDGFSIVDLNLANESIVIDDLTDQIFTFYTSFPDADTQTDPLSDTFDVTNFNTNDVILWVRVENRFGCSSITQLEVDIQTPTISSFNYRIEVCDDFRDVNGFDNENNDDTDGISFFNFTDPNNDGNTIDSIVTGIINSFPAIDRPNLIVHFYHNELDALQEENEILNITNYRNIDSANNEILFIRVTDNLGLSCPGFGPQVELRVIPIPQILLDENGRTFTGCDDNNDGLVSFDTGSLEVDLLGLSQLSDVILTYFYQDGSPVVPGSPTIFPDPFITNTQIILVKATNNVLSNCEVIFNLTYIVNTLPIANSILDQIVCDNGNNDQDGLGVFDTSSIQEEILGGPTAQLNMIITYRDQFLNILPSPLPDPFETVSQTITVDVENPNDSQCIVSTTIEFVVNDTPNFQVNDAVICLDIDPAEIRIPIESAEGNYTYTWFQIIDGEDILVPTNTTNDFLDVLVEGEYEVVATTTDGNFCQKDRLFTVVASNEVILETVLITDTTFSNSSSVIIEISGIGDYEYALDVLDINDDDGYQDTNTFNFVSFGLHTITIRDKNGCGIITEEFVILEYQKFFTPNNDGDFETWNLNNVSGLLSVFNNVSDVTIYNRHGKIMAVIDPNGEGWNGKYKGKEVLSTDYWFSVELIDFNGKIFIKKGHFSLRL